MTDDNCGHPTDDGGECQNPATEDGHCWLDAHGGDTEVGRNFAITEDDYEDILQAAREGLSQSGCARAVGVDIKSLQRYLEAHDEFRQAFRRARNEGEQSLVRRGLGDPETDSSMAKFLLSTSFDYIKTEKREVDMDADVDHKGGVTADFIAFSEADDE